ncbi:hypothetical protein R1flu_019071 [Riccia fluitans]|uniref:RWP-RK domain-containing protein n=1 Tax=Riccia fluitans TaxID=41844 RepID=A0ABD1ZHT3_9MARC
MNLAAGASSCTKEPHILCVSAVWLLRRTREFGDKSKQWRLIEFGIRVSTGSAYCVGEFVLLVKRENFFFWDDVRRIAKSFSVADRSCAFHGRFTRSRLLTGSMQAPSLLLTAPVRVRKAVNSEFEPSTNGKLSSARHVNETLQEFARVIQRNARRLVFIGENDRIQRLQLAQADGSEPEELDVDATLEDVIICMGNKHLVAIITPAKSPTACNDRPEAEKLGPPSPMGHQKSKSKKDAANDYFLPATPSAALSPEETELTTFGLGTRVSPFRSSYEPPVRGLKITIPSADSNHAVNQDERNPFDQDLTAGERQTIGTQPLAPRLSNYNGEILGNSGLPGAITSSVTTPSPAELAHFLVRGSSIPLNRPPPPRGVCMNATTMYPSCHSGGPNVAGFQTLAPTLLNRLPVIPSSNPVCATATHNIALLVQFLASQLRAFIPVNGTASPSDSLPFSPSGNNKVKVSSSEAAPAGNNPGETVDFQNADKPPEKSCLKGYRHGPENESQKPATETVKPTVSETHDKDDSSSSANVNTTAAPSSDGLESENMHDRSELVFLVNRRSKTGVGSHHLKLSDLSAFFHLSVVDAAKKLGVSQTTLKKACRKFGLKRWPGRKVRSLESTIHGLEHTIAVGQGAGMEELTEAYMRSEVSKLQQEMDQLVHGTATQQHSPVARTADLYKRLYSRGWRSKYHSSCGRFDLDLNTESRGSEGFVSFNRRKATDEAKPPNAKPKAENGGLSPDAVEPNGTTPKASFGKDDSLSQTDNGGIDNIDDNASSLCSSKGAQLGLLKESTADEKVELATNGNRSRTQKKLEELPVDVEVIDLEPEKDTLVERCPKRHKTEVA